MRNSSNQSERAESLSRGQENGTPKVAGRQDHFSAVKIELIIVIFVGISMFFVVEALLPSSTWGILVLMLTGFLGAAWLVFRTKRISRKLQDHDNGAQ